jgi:hypothetical protein
VHHLLSRATQLLGRLHLPTSLCRRERDPGSGAFSPLWGGDAARERALKAAFFHSDARTEGCAQHCLTTCKERVRSFLFEARTYSLHIACRTRLFFFSEPNTAKSCLRCRCTATVGVRTAIGQCNRRSVDDVMGFFFAAKARENVPPKGRCAVHPRGWATVCCVV